MKNFRIVDRYTGEVVTEEDIQKFYLSPHKNLYETFVTLNGKVAILCCSVTNSGIGIERPEDLIVEEMENK